MDHTLHIYTDGACLGNPGPGGWAAYHVQNGGDGPYTFSYGNEDSTTNNRMELTAVIQGLEDAIGMPDVIVFTDSKYVVDGITSWIQGWKRRGWMTADEKPVKNVDLWQKLDELTTHFPNLTFKWVKGHAGNHWNEKADRLASVNAREAANRTNAQVTETLKLFDVKGKFADGDMMEQYIWANNSDEAARLFVDYLDGDLDISNYLLVVPVPLDPPAKPGVEERFAPVRVQTPGNEPTFLFSPGEFPSCPDCSVRLSMDEETVDGVLQNRVVDEDEDGPIHLGTCMEHGAFRVQFLEDQ